MKNSKTKPRIRRCIFSIVFFVTSGLLINLSGQAKKVLLFDLAHGENKNLTGLYTKLLSSEPGAGIETCSEAITSSVLKDKHGLILFSPVSAFQEPEKKAIGDYLRSGGSLLLMFDEERRMSLKGVGVNDIIVPFNIKLTDDIPVRHNCGAVADKSEVCAGKREIPFSGGRSVEGGTVISKVFDEGNYTHCAYVRLETGGKIIVMSDAMVALLLGGPDGVRFSGTGPADSKYWGKDSQVYMEEILAFLLKD